MERTTFCLPRKFSNVVSCLTQGAFMCPCVSHWIFICAYRVNFSKYYNFTLQHISRSKSTQQKALQNFAVVAWRYSIILRCSPVLYFTYSKDRRLLSLCKLMSSPFKEFRIILTCYQRNLLRSIDIRRQLYRDFRDLS